MLEELIEILKELRDVLSNSNINNDKNITILKVTDVAKIMGINNNKATELWDREDFPGIIIGHRMIEKHAFYKWLQEKRN